MKTFGKLAATGMAAMLCSTALAMGLGDAPVLLKVKRCNACHDEEKALIGPPWKAISLRYQADRQKSIEMLTRKIITGGGGSWGVVPMVPNEHVAEADARAMAEWILNLSAR